MPSRDVKPLVSLHLIFYCQTLKHCLSLTWTLCCCRATCSGDSLETNSCTCCLLSSSWASSLESPPPPSDNRSRSSRSAEVGAATPSLLTELSWAQWKIILFVLKGFLQIFYTCSMDILSLYNEMYIKALKISMIYLYLGWEPFYFTITIKLIKIHFKSINFFLSWKIRNCCIIIYKTQNTSMVILLPHVVG